MKNLKYFITKSTMCLMLVCMLITFTSAKRCCKQTCRPAPLTLASVHIVDRNGISEAITNKERLNQYLNVDFLSPQPYQKVLRIYTRDINGNLKAQVNSYHENGNPMQYLEVMNGRALGKYQEWHANGLMSISTKIIGGEPDVSMSAQKTWLFDDVSYAWNENGCLIAEIPYSQGVLEGLSVDYHANGQVWKRTAYSKNKLDGLSEIYKMNGELLQQTTYVQGSKHGPSYRFWGGNQLASQEEYFQNRLVTGCYFDKSGALISEVQNGTGFRAIFGKDSLYELQEYRQGVLEGEVRVYTPQGKLLRVYSMKKDLKHGEEIQYFEESCLENLQPHLSIQWYEGNVQGISRSWYSNGNQESQKEMAKNAKNGVATAWYRDGNLMMIEEYESNKLVRGDYYRKGERIPVTQVIEGGGTATIFDEHGHFVKKISYSRGKPEL